MKARTVYLLAAALFVGLLTAASLGYRYLRDSYVPETAPAGEVQEQVRKDMAPDFSVTDRSGQTVLLSEQQGKPVLVNFWASWCGPCRSEMAVFEEAWKSYGDQITFMMVNLSDGVRETTASAADFVDQNGYTFPVYFDTTGNAVSAYELYAVPRTVAVSPEGELLYDQAGALTERTMDSILGMLLSEE